jgi:hypothetical protein
LGAHHATPHGHPGDGVSQNSTGAASHDG